jgi:ERCC4-related helicase
MELPHRTVNYERNAENPRVDAVIRNVEQFWDKADRKKDQSSVIVFSNTKDGVEEYGKALSQKFGGKKIRVIHGDKEQSERNRGIGNMLDVLRVHCGHVLSLMNLLLHRRLQGWAGLLASGY